MLLSKRPNIPIHHGSPYHGGWMQSIHRHPWRSLVAPLEVTNLQWHPWNWCSLQSSTCIGFVDCDIRLTFRQAIQFLLVLSMLNGIDGPDQYHWYVCRLVLMVPRGTESSVLSAPWTTSYESDHRFGLFPSSSHGTPLDDTTLQWLPCNTWAPLEDTDLQWHPWNSCRYSNIVDRPMSTLLLRWMLIQELWDTLSSPSPGSAPMIVSLSLSMSLFYPTDNYK